jgi:hypothetical protein
MWEINFILLKILLCVKGLLLVTGSIHYDDTAAGNDDNNNNKPIYIDGKGIFVQSELYIHNQDIAFD